MHVKIDELLMLSQNLSEVDESKLEFFKRKCS